ncbi:MAG: N-acetyl-1-D-myo-inositol-2-amino-2-deoxy-alpha-D-glucopyranoside deacetylase [Actinomycetes bacterium]
MSDSDPPADRRMLLVHAHPDDETIATGVTMARYVAEGAAVTLVTCTRGEEGEVLLPELEKLAAHHDDELGPHRVQELAAAMRVLGVTDHRFLGGVGRWRDSGMMGTQANNRDDCFWRADLLEASAELCAVVRETRPQVLVTYDTFGGYGHPDHIQAHRTAMYVAQLAAAPAFRPELGPAWDVQKIYWSALPRTYVQQGIDALIAAGKTAFFGVDSADDLPFLVDDELVTSVVEAVDYEPLKMAALREHASQVEQDSAFFQMAQLVGPEAFGTEFFCLVKGTLGTASRGDDGRERDLFDGVTPVV